MLYILSPHAQLVMPEAVCLALLGPHHLSLSGAAPALGMAAGSPWDLPHCLQALGTPRSRPQHPACFSRVLSQKLPTSGLARTSWAPDLQLFLHCPHTEGAQTQGMAVLRAIPWLAPRPQGVSRAELALAAGRQAPAQGHVAGRDQASLCSDSDVPSPQRRLLGC